jgi:hypothetical protein
MLPIVFDLALFEHAERLTREVFGAWHIRWVLGGIKNVLQLGVGSAS